MAIHVKRIYEPPGDRDGQRVLVDRVWPRGVSKAEAGLTAWQKDIAPSAALRKWFGHDPARWEQFGRRYRRELDDNAEEVKRLEEMARSGALTLLYGARDTEHNQAVVLADYIRKRLARKS
ncbi:MAG: DUF488 domain-containing protein [Sphingomonadales bacterium]